LARLAGGIGLADDGGQERITAEVVVVVEVLVAQRQGGDALGDQLLHGVFGEAGVAVVGEAGGELAEDAGESLGLAEQQGAAVGGDGAAVEVGEDVAAAEHGKVEVGRVTLCFHRAALVRCRRWLAQLHL
jgi:hypothetical protein